MPRFATWCLIVWCSLPSLTCADELTIIAAPELRATLDELSGQVVLVNFWATWCRPCLEEIPLLTSLEREYRARGFRLVAVSLDDVGGAETLVRPFMQKWFPGFRSYLSSERDRDSMVSIVDPAWNEVLPTSYLIAADGEVAERLQGEKPQDEFARLIEAQLER